MNMFTMNVFINVIMTMMNDDYDDGFYLRLRHFFQMLGYNTHEPKILCSLN